MFLTHPINLQPSFRAHKYVEEILKLLPQKPNPILLASILTRMANLGAIHPIPVSDPPSSLAKILPNRPYLRQIASDLVVYPFLFLPMIYIPLLIITRSNSGENFPFLFERFLLLLDKCRQINDYSGVQTCEIRTSTTLSPLNKIFAIDTVPQLREYRYNAHHKN